MKFKGTPNLLVRINKPRKGEVKLFVFDENGLYETNHPITMARMKANYEEVIEEPEEIIEVIEEELEINEKELRQRAKEAGIKSWHVKSIDNLIKELEG